MDTYYSEGTYEDAVNLISPSLGSPDFKWLSKTLGVYNNPQLGLKITFSQYQIEVNGVCMKLSMIDYFKYLRFLKSIQPKYEATKIESSKTPWRE